MKQIQQLGVEMKDEHLVIQLVQKLAKKIELMQFYIEFELLYENIKKILSYYYWAMFLTVGIFTCYTSIIKNKERQENKTRNKQHCQYVVWVVRV